MEQDWVQSDPAVNLSPKDGMYYYADQQECQKYCSSDPECKLYLAGSLKFSKRDESWAYKFKGNEPIGCFLLYQDCENYRTLDEGVRVYKGNREMIESYSDPEKDGKFAQVGQWRLPTDANIKA